MFLIKIRELFCEKNRNIRKKTTYFTMLKIVKSHRICTNVMVSSLTRNASFHQVSCWSVPQLLRNLAHKQTDWGENITSLPGKELQRFSTFDFFLYQLILVRWYACSHSPPKHTHTHTQLCTSGFNKRLQGQIFVLSPDFFLSISSTDVSLTPFGWNTN